jgi:hypothetical protein
MYFEPHYHQLVRWCQYNVTSRPKYTMVSVAVKQNQTLKQKKKRKDKKRKHSFYLCKVYIKQHTKNHLQTENKRRTNAVDATKSL